MGGRLSRVGLRVATALTLLFLYVPIFIVVVYAFNDSEPVLERPPRPSRDRRLLQHVLAALVRAALSNIQVRESFLLSLQAALGATVVALLLGSLAAFAVHRHRFFGRGGISFVLVLPIALPGIVTGMALNSACRHRVSHRRCTFG